MARPYSEIQDLDSLNLIQGIGTGWIRDEINPISPGFKTVSCLLYSNRQGS